MCHCVKCDLDICSSAIQSTTFLNVVMCTQMQFIQYVSVTLFTWTCNQVETGSTKNGFEPGFHLFPLTRHCVAMHCIRVSRWHWKSGSSVCFIMMWPCRWCAVCHWIDLSTCFVSKFQSSPCSTTFNSLSFLITGSTLLETRVELGLLTRVEPRFDSLTLAHVNPDQTWL